MQNATTTRYSALAMPYRPFTEQNCSIADALEIVGERWTLLVMREVLFGRRRFGEISATSASRRTSSATASQQLVEHGLLERRPTGDGGESHEYVPTPQGHELSTRCSSPCCSWGDDYAVPEGGPPRVQVHTPAATTRTRGCTAATAASRSGPASCRSRPGPGASPKQIADGILPKTVSLGDIA